MASTTLSIGDTGEATLVVGPRDSAKALATAPEDDFPDVLATSRMIALMELAAARVLGRLLGSGELSVGVGVQIEHLAATPIGVEVKAVATLLRVEGKRYRFKVQAFDQGGLVGEGEHTRAIVGRARLERGAFDRNQRSVKRRGVPGLRRAAGPLWAFSSTEPSLALWWL